MVKMPRVAIIGAGISGIACARHLKDSGVSSVVFEKSRGIGGRLATRRNANELDFDHGAQYFTARSADFRKFIKMYCAEDVVSWRPQVGGEPPEAGDWLVSAPGMNGFLKKAASELEVRLDTAVTHIERTKNGWQLNFSAPVPNEVFDVVIITAPAKQAIALTSFSDQLRELLASIRMSPCWTLMLALKGRSNIERDVILEQSHEIFWLARNSSKPGRNHANETWVAHASPAWSVQHLELEKEAVAARLRTAVLVCLKLADSDVAFADAHRWRFAKVERSTGKPFLADETGTVFVCGDGCLGPRVEAAYQSGSALAAHIVSTAALRP